MHVPNLVPVITMAIYGTLALSWCCTSGGFLFSLLTIILVVDVKCVFLVRSFNMQFLFDSLRIKKPLFLKSTRPLKLTRIASQESKIVVAEYGETISMIILALCMVLLTMILVVGTSCVLYLIVQCFSYACLQTTVYF